MKLPINRIIDNELNSIKLSSDEIHSFKGLENISEVEVEQLAEFLAIYAISVYQAMKNNGDNNMCYDK